MRPQHETWWRRIGGAAIGALALIIIIALIPPWDRSLMAHGVYYRPDRFDEELRGEYWESVDAQNLVYYQEGRDGVVTVRDTGDQRLLIINGKTDASSKGDLRTQTLLAHIPLLIHPDPENALIIGLGSSITAGAAANHDSLDAITVLEISEEVVAASDFFVEENGDVLADPRVKLVEADARNFVLADETTYDVIISEPSNPWISGVSNLFTREFFEMAKGRLAPDGIMAQWFHIYSMSDADLKTVLNTFREVFPHMTVWQSQAGDLVLIGSEAPHALGANRLRAIRAPSAGDDSVAADLAEVDALRLHDIMSTFLLDEENLAEFTAQAQINTDNRPRIEFNAPRYFYSSTTVDNLNNIALYLADSDLIAPVENIVEAHENRLDIPLLGLAIDTQPLTTEEWDAKWLIQRRMVEGEVVDDGVELIIGNKGSLTWREEDAETQLAILGADEPREPAWVRDLLENLPLGTLAQGGDFELTTGQPGHWVVGLDEEANVLQVALGFSCPDPITGTNMYVGVRSLPGRTIDQWEEAFVDFAGTFHCQVE